MKHIFNCEGVEVEVECSGKHGLGQGCVSGFGPACGYGYGCGIALCLGVVLV